MRHSTLCGYLSVIHLMSFKQQHQNPFDRVVTTEDSANNCLDYHREKLD